MSFHAAARGGRSSKIPESDGLAQATPGNYPSRFPNELPAQMALYSFENVSVFT
jgi:hypothetical protein